MPRPQHIPQRIPRICALAVLAALAGCSVLAGCSSASSSIPPLSSPARGEFRVYAGTTQSVPMSYTSETLPDGTKVTIGIGPSSIHTVNGKPAAFFALQYPGEPSSEADSGFWLSPGGSHLVGGRYRFAVLQIWDTGSQADHAADVQITGVEG
jgi:hypothetical protein